MRKKAIDRALRCMAAASALGFWWLPRGDSLGFHEADPSSDPGCPHDQKQPCRDENDPDGSGDALTGGCETFDGDGGRHDRHRTQVHDSETQEDRHQPDIALGAMKAEAQAVSPRRAGVGRH